MIRVQSVTIRNSDNQAINLLDHNGVQACRRFRLRETLNSCANSITLELSARKFQQINDMLTAKVGEVGQLVQIYATDGTNIWIMMVGIITRVAENLPYVVIEAGSTTSRLQEYRADLSINGHPDGYPVAEVMYTVMTASLSDPPSVHTYYESNQAVMLEGPSDADDLYIPKGITRQDLLSRLSLLSSYESGTPVVYFPDRAATDRMLIRDFGGGGVHTSTGGNLWRGPKPSGSPGNIIGRIELTRKDVDSVINDVYVYWYWGEISKGNSSSQSSYGQRSFSVHAPELGLQGDAYHLADGIMQQYAAATPATRVTTTYDAVCSASAQDVLNRRFSVTDYTGPVITAVNGKVIQYELEWPSMRVHLFLRQLGLTVGDLSDMLSNTARRLDRVERTVMEAKQDALLTVPSDNVHSSHDAEIMTQTTDYVKVKTITFIGGGITRARVSFEGYVNSYYETYYGQLRKNGVNIGAEQSITSNTSYKLFSQDLTLNIKSGDTLELWVKRTGSASLRAYTRNFRVAYDYAVPSTNS